MTYRAVYDRYHHRQCLDFPTDEEARTFLFQGEDEGWCSAVSVVAPDGTVTPFDYPAECERRDP